jgi:predicted AAA+ superfamily ATPase
LEKYEIDDIFFWRTTECNEVDFVMSNIENPFAVEVKYNENVIKESKYRIFRENYPEIPLHFAYLEPFDEGFFWR